MSAVMPMGAELAPAAIDPDERVIIPLQGRVNLPAPPVPADADLRDYPYMPLYIARLRRSGAWRAARRRPEIGFYMLNLWTFAWHELPAGSLENDAEALADAAECDLDHWNEVRELVMRGWTLCSDGRLHHVVVSELVLETLGTRRKKSTAGTAGAEARWNKRSASTGQPTLDGCDRNATAMRSHGKRGEVKGGEDEGILPLDFADAKSRGDDAGAREAPYRVPQEEIVEAMECRAAAGKPPAALVLEAERFAEVAGTIPAAERREAWLRHAMNAEAAPEAAAFGARASPAAAGFAADDVAMEGENEHRSGEAPDKRGSRLPVDWEPDADDRSFAAGLGLSADEIADEFRDYWLSEPGQRGRKLDWSRTFRNRCREVASRRGSHGLRRAQPAPNRPGAGSIAAAVSRIRLPGEMG